MLLNNECFCLQQYTSKDNYNGSPSGESQVVIPDSIKYYFRLSSDDPLWEMLEKQGHDIARFVSLYAVRDTLYALINLLAGYDTETVPSSGGEPIMQIVLRSGQVVMKMYNGTVDVILLPPRYDITKLLAYSTGMVGGIYVDTERTGSHNSHGSPQFVMIDGNHIIRRDSTQCSVRVWNQLQGGSQSLASAVLAPDDALWYCDGSRQLLVRVLSDGVMQEIGTRAFELSTTATVKAGTNAGYACKDLIALRDAVVLLLMSTDSLHTSFALQMYDNSGAFLYQWAVPDEGNTLESVQLLGMERNEILALGRTETRQWRLLRSVLPSSDSSLPAHFHSGR